MDVLHLDARYVLSGGKYKKSFEQYWSYPSSPPFLPLSTPLPRSRRLLETLETVVNNKCSKCIVGCSSFQSPVDKKFGVNWQNLFLAMGSLAVLVGPRGEPELTLQVLCDDVPLRALSHVDPATDHPSVRFVAPGPGGRLTVRLHNGGVRAGCYLELERAELGPKDSWEKCEAGQVNKANLLYHGESMTVRRDESTGGRSILVEALRDAQGRPLGEQDAEVRGLARTKWRLGAWPERNGDQQLSGSRWRLLDAKQGREVPLCVRTPTGDALLAACPTDSIDSLQASIERELGIPLAEQRLRAADGSCPDGAGSLCAALGKGFPTLYVCGKQTLGPNLWLYVQHPKGKKFLAAKSCEEVNSLLSEVPGYRGGLDGLFLDGKELRGDRPLSCYNVACLDTLEMRERGSLRLSFTVEDADKAPVTVEVGVDPEDAVAVLRRRVILKTITDSIQVRRLNRSVDCVLALGDEKLDLDRSVAESGLCSTQTAHLVLRIPARPPSSVIYIKILFLTGKLRLLECYDSDTIAVVKERIRKWEGVWPDYQTIIWSGMRLQDGVTLRDYGIRDEDTLYLLMNLRGGGEVVPDWKVVKGLVDEDAASPEGVEPVPAPPAPSGQDSAGVLAVGKIVSGGFVPPPNTVSCEFEMDLFGASPKLQFDVFVDETCSSN
ncbi:uncharacterized protein LOC117647696 [Thrips palmi]|uniref:Uncharacterized protein LOC117647696 n=1 Tax=Thrips palmi TaxID=161013 RepID=A0A6P8ZBQ2_THRPL|nr:uncharacterized protein LOC117647696 [Thrips palmi]